MMDDTYALLLRPATPADLEHLYRFQLNEEAIHMAAFTPKDPTDRAAYLDKWTKLLADPTITMRIILVDGVIAGSVSKYLMHGEAEITYWIDRPLWGRGITSAALKEFLTIETVRPIYGHIAFDNIGSQRVLEKCGFVRIGTEKGFANARGAEIEELVYRLG